MNNEYMEKIAEYYKALNPYERNEEYSKKHQTVYTAPHSDRWLVFEDKNKNIMQARLTDVHGRIQIWEDYTLEDGLLQMKNTTCIDTDGTHTVEFSPEEIMFILRFGDYDRSNTEYLMSGMVEWLDTAHEEALAQGIADKLKRISDVTFNNMFIIAHNREEAAKKLPLADRLKDLEFKRKILNIPLRRGTSYQKIREKER